MLELEINYLHECIISRRAEVCAHKTCLSQQLFIEEKVLSKKKISSNVNVCIKFVFTTPICRLDFGTVRTV